MNCTLFSALSRTEQSEFFGRLIIAVQNDNVCLQQAQRIIARAEKVGIYQTTQPGADKSALSDLDNPIENGVGGI